MLSADFIRCIKKFWVLIRQIYMINKEDVSIQAAFCNLPNIRGKKGVLCQKLFMCCIMGCIITWSIVPCAKCKGEKNTFKGFA